MTDVKWIKITTDIFDDEKILLIESLPEADSIIVIWFKLLCLAGKINNSGVFLLNDAIPYTDKMLSTIFRRKDTTVSLALKTFESLGMIEFVDDVITIPNWGKHQSLDQLESKREYQRNYMREYREKQSLIACKTNSKSNSKTKSNTNCNTNVSSLDKDIDIDIDKEREEETEKEKHTHVQKESYQDVISIYNETCVSYPRVTRISDKRINTIKARLKKYSLLDFQTLFEKAEASDFLKGVNRDWKANFDWLINETNMVKVLEGNYDNRKKQYSNKLAQELDDSYEMMRQWVEEGEG